MFFSQYEILDFNFWPFRMLYFVKVWSFRIRRVAEAQVDWEALPAGQVGRVLAGASDKIHQTSFLKVSW